MPHADDGTGPVILHVNPPELGACLSAIGPERLNGRRLVGYWAWEQQQIPDSWVRAARWLDEIWVPSDFVRQAVGAKVDVPVITVGYPAGLYADRPVDKGGWRSRLSLPEDGFLVLAAFDPRSNIFRKNPQGAVAAFKEAFAKDESVRMVLKVTGEIEPALRQELIGGDDRIIVQEGYLETDDMLALIASADCVLNLHRAEGYGLLPVQALCLGVPAVMTGWSSVTDFADCPGAFLTGFEPTTIAFSEGQYDSVYGDWAEPMLEDAVGHLRQIRNMSNEQRLALGQSAADWWRVHHSPAAFVDRLPASTRDLFKPA